MDGTVVIGSLSKLNFVPQPLGQTQLLSLSGSVYNLHSCTGQACTPQPCGRAHSEFYVSRQPLFSLLSPLYSPVSSTCISFSLASSIFSNSLCSWWVCLGLGSRGAAAHVRDGSEEDRGLGAAPSALGIGLARHGGRRASRGPRAGVSMTEGRHRDVKVSSEEQLVPGSPRCSCCFQMFRMKKTFP